MSLRYLSLFSGLEAAHLAWQPLGWTCAAVAEIDPPACAVLAHRLPGVPNLGDVSQIGDRQIAALGHIDVVIGGSPCQDLSVAGKRAGLAGARSGLFHEQLRIFHAARHLCGARWLVWENVPGAFSSNKGRDFAVVAGALAGCELDVPTDGWGSEGVALGDNGLVEWAVLDAQWFGVAQRRRRVFAVLDTGDWANRPPVLLEPESLRGDSAPRRETGEGVAGTLGARTPGGGGLGTDFELSGGLTVAHTLRADGFDASEDGTGRGTPLVPVAAMAHGQGGAELTAGERSPTLTCNHEAPIVAFDTTQITSKANGSNPQPGDHCHPLTAGGHAPALAFNWQSGGDCRGLEPAETTNALHCGQTPAALSGMAVRRLTPRECERLQAAPEMRKVLRIEVCGENQKNDAIAGNQSLRSPSHALNVGESACKPHANAAAAHLNTSPLGQEKPVALRVHIDLERPPHLRLWIERFASPASNAEKVSACIPAKGLADFAHLVATICSIAVNATHDGKAGSLPSMTPSTLRWSGSRLVRLSGREISDGAADAEKNISALRDSLKSTTLPAEQTSQSFDSTLKTWCCFVVRAICSCIPSETVRESSFVVEIEVAEGWTLVPNAKGKPMADGPRYKMLGNSFAVPVVRHIGVKIMEAVNGVQ